LLFIDPDADIDPVSRRDEPLPDAGADDITGAVPPGWKDDRRVPASAVCKRRLDVEKMDGPGGGVTWPVGEVHRVSTCS